MRSRQENAEKTNKIICQVSLLFDHTVKAPLSIPINVIAQRDNEKGRSLAYHQQTRIAWLVCLDWACHREAVSKRLSSCTGTTQTEALVDFLSVSLSQITSNWIESMNDWMDGIGPLRRKCRRWIRASMGRADKWFRGPSDERELAPSNAIANRWELGGAFLLTGWRSSRHIQQWHLSCKPAGESLPPSLYLRLPNENSR